MNSLLKKFKKDKISLIAVIVLVLMYLAILFASFLSPYEKNSSNRELSYSPPVKIYTITPDNKLSKPYFYNLKREFDPHTLSTTYHEVRDKKHYVKFFAKGFEYKLFGLIKTNIHLIGTRDVRRI